MIGRRGATHPRRPASTRMAGSNVIAARNATVIETAKGGADTRERGQAGEDHAEERDGDRGRRGGDDLADRPQRLLHRQRRIPRRSRRYSW